MVRLTMSVEDIELRDLMTQTLELNGCLSKIRAQLRASIFLALDEDAKISKQEPLMNNKIKSCVQTPEGQLMFCLVREFLEYFNLDWTISVFEPESHCGSLYKYKGHKEIYEKLDLKDVDSNLSGPALLQLIKLFRKQCRTSLNLSADKSRNDSEETGTLLVNGMEKTNLLLKDEPGVNKHDNLTTSQESEECLNNTFVINRGDQCGQPVQDNCSDVEDAAKKATTKIVQSESDKKDNKLKTKSINLCSNTEDTCPNENKCLIAGKETTSWINFDPDISLEAAKRKSPELPYSSKPCISGVLPSLYSKEFKSGSKDLDIHFCNELEYEDDFLTGSETEYSSHKSNHKDQRHSVNSNSLYQDKTEKSTAKTEKQINDITSSLECDAQVSFQESPVPEEKNNRCTEEKT